MPRLFAALVPFLACLFTTGLAGSASAQLSNSLGASTQSGLPDVAALEADIRPVFYQPARIRSILEQGGMTIVDDQLMPQLNARVIVADAAGLPLIFTFGECGEAGCYLLKQIHPIPSQMLGVPASPQLVNQINVGLPAGALLADEDHNMIFRLGTSAAPECGDGCHLAQMKLFMALIQGVYIIIDDLSGRETASLDGAAFAAAPLSPSGGDVDAAALAHLGAGIGEMAPGMAQAAALQPDLDMETILTLAGLAPAEDAVSPHRGGGEFQAPLVAD